MPSPHTPARQPDISHGFTSHTAPQHSLSPDPGVGLLAHSNRYISRAQDRLTLGWTLFSLSDDCDLLRIKGDAKHVSSMTPKPQMDVCRPNLQASPNQRSYMEPPSLWASDGFPSCLAC
eukprot:EG_transcript_28227